MLLGSKTNISNCRFWKKLTYDWLVDNPTRALFGQRSQYSQRREAVFRGQKNKEIDVPGWGFVVSKHLLVMGVKFGSILALKSHNSVTPRALLPKLESWVEVLDLGKVRTTECPSNRFTVPEENVDNSCSNTKICGQKICRISGGERRKTSRCECGRIKLVVYVEDCRLIENSK